MAVPAGRLIPHLNWLPKAAWEIWRDLTWCRYEKRKWLEKMRHYHSGSPELAVSRARMIVEHRPLDWDDNVPEKWARSFLAEMGIAHDD